MSKWIDIKKELFRNGAGVCEVCEMRPSSELHHAIIRRDKRFSTWTDNIINAQKSCHVCNVVSRKADSWENTQKHIRNQIDRHGYEAVKDWLESAPPKKKLGDRWRQAWNYLLRIKP